MSRLGLARDAVRPALKARLMLSGPAGAGKTRSALIAATVLAEGGPVVVLDTERESALTYADDFTFKHVAWDPPYDPRELSTTIADAGDSYAVVIVDSASHFWRGDGGTLDIADGKFTGWKVARPAQDDLVSAILNCKAHVILCGRAKVEHVQEYDERTGKHVVKKLGMAVIQSDDLEYELNIAAELDMEHRIAVSKSRCITVPVGKVFAPGHAEEFAQVYGDWLKGGEPPAAQVDVDGLRERINGLPESLRASCKQEFKARFGLPDHLSAAQVDDAELFVATWEARLPDVEDRGESGSPAQPESPGSVAVGDTPDPPHPVSPDEPSVEATAGNVAGAPDDSPAGPGHQLIAGEGAAAHDNSPAPDPEPERLCNVVDRFLADTVNAHWPPRSKGRPEAVKQIRRLMYVACTQARPELGPPCARSAAMNAAQARMVHRTATGGVTEVEYVAATPDGPARLILVHGDDAPVTADAGMLARLEGETS